MDQEAATPEHKAKVFRLMAIMLGAFGIGMFGVATTFLTGMLGGADHHQMVGSILILVGFSELGLAWFFFNKSQSL